MNSPAKSEMPVVGTRHYDTGVLVRDDRPVHRVLAFDVAARVGELCDLVATAVVDVYVAGAHWAWVTR